MSSDGRESALCPAMIVRARAKERGRSMCLNESVDVSEVAIC